jgi:hypothetical protein
LLHHLILSHVLADFIKLRQGVFKAVLGHVSLEELLFQELGLFTCTTLSWGSTNKSSGARL